MNHVRSTYRAARAAICLILFSLTSIAQSDLTSVTGSVHDPSGSMVPNATVILRNQATGAERSATTNAAGNYTISSIPGGTYTLIVEAPGFQRDEQAGHTILANSTRTT